MILDVYVDLFFLINFSMDYICLYITSKILRHNVSAKKYIAASVLGGAYSVLALFISMNSVISVLIDALVCVIMVLICFYSKGDGIWHTFGSSLLYVGISMLLGGIMTAIFNLLNRLELNFDGLTDDGAHTYDFAIIAIVAAALSMKGISVVTKKNRHREYFVTVTLNQKECTLLGFVDTGNLVNDAVSGKSVIFLDRSAAHEFIHPDTEERFYRGEILYPGTRLIPISTAGGSSMTLVFTPDRVTVKEKSHRAVNEFEVDCLIALSEMKNDTYSAIIPESIIKLKI